MNRFAALLDRLAFEPGRNGKILLLQDYFRTTPDPDRGFALAAIARDLTFQHAKPGIIRGLIGERVDPTLFAMSYDYVGDLSETVALLWPGGAPAQSNHNFLLSEVVETLAQTGKAQLPKIVSDLLDGLDENGRWALLKLITGGLRIGVSARMAKTAIAANADVPVNSIEEIWPALKPPYRDLFRWIDGDGEKPANASPLAFRPVMLAQALDEKELDAMSPADFQAEWKWDGVRVQAVCARQGEHFSARLYSRNGEDMTRSFPDVIEHLTASATENFVIDGELLIMRDGNVASSSQLQQRLNRKSVTAKLLQQWPAHIRAYDLLFLRDDDLRQMPFSHRRAQLEVWAAAANVNGVSLSAPVVFDNWQTLQDARSATGTFSARADDAAIEGLMLKRKDSAYVPGRPKGLWYKWKRDPFLIDAVLMYAQRGHGRRSSFYSDYTFGVWRSSAEGDELVPVGKAYFGFTDAELNKIDRFVRDNTINRFGPVREVESGKDDGLVFEVAFEGLQRSSRHKSGLAMRFPRVSRIRWDKPAGEADRIENLQQLLPAED